VQIITAVQNDLKNALRLLSRDPITSGPVVHDEEDDEEELLQQMLADKGSCTTSV
jgi:hypothetical protein